jgi:Holliday junction DNA helicase RuvA
MWNSISGEITRKGLEQVFLQSGDMEWDIAMGRFGLDALPPVGQRARVYVWLSHTEDAM